MGSRASRYLAAECGCRVAAIDLTPNFVEVARILTARCGVADRVEIRQANALALPFQDGTFDHVWSYAVTMNIADKRRLGRELARVLKPGRRFSCNEIELGCDGAPMFSSPWATDRASSFLVSPAAMRAALEAAGLSTIEQVDLTATRLHEKDTDNRTRRLPLAAAQPSELLGRWTSGRAVYSCGEERLAQHARRTASD